MKYALENIETLILTELHPDVIQLRQPAEEDLFKYISKITAEKNQVRSKLKKKLFSCKKEKSVELLVQQYQSALINLTNELIQSKRSIESYPTDFTKEEISIITVLQHGLKCMEELLTFIEKHFSRYFNLDEKIPDSYKLLMQSECRQNLQLLIKKYKRTDLDATLVGILMAPFHSFLKIDIYTQFTYKELLYLKTLNKEFSEILILSQKQVDQKSIVDLLFYLNFNNTGFINYYINIISKDVNELDAITLQIEQLAWWTKKISQVRMKPEVALIVKDPSVKIQLIEWMENEMTFLEKKHQLTLVVPLHPESTNEPVFNIKTSFSVRLIALFTRVLIDLEFIRTDNLTKLLTKIAGVFKTDRKDNLSPGSLRTRFYLDDEGTKNTLKAILMKMINQINKY